jgi:hypothetical protein
MRLKLSYIVSEAPRTFVAFQLTCPMSQKILNLVKEWGKYEGLGVKRFSVQ